jgi:hypothetical protein
MDGERDRESECCHDADDLASVLVGLGHHRLREHGEDRTGCEGENEGDGVRRGALEQREYAARGGLDSKTFCWGNEFAPRGKIMANTRQGEFPRLSRPSWKFVTAVPV